ncbi:MAG TPA: hypothetical protein VH115_08500 [Solirubrobacteraceae bacterium]|nr:hypothetical protein [Solirubrobacteraceae bacterium]
MSNPVGWRPSRRIRARLVTGPLAHFVGGAADLVEALTRYGLARALALRTRRGGRRQGVR